MTFADPGKRPGRFVFGLVGRSTTVQKRTETLESRIIHGPVVILIGTRITGERPCPRRDRRSPVVDDSNLVA